MEQSSTAATAATAAKKEITTQFYEQSHDYLIVP
jgi:hypothetical protein